MQTKLFEIRDYGTCIVVAAMQTKGESTPERRLLRRGGWGERSIILCDINGKSECTHDPFIWKERGNDTLFYAHMYIQKNFDQLENHSVIDVEYINGKTKDPKQSEIINNPIYDF